MIAPHRRSCRTRDYFPKCMLLDLGSAVSVFISESILAFWFIATGPYWPTGRRLGLQGCLNAPRSYATTKRAAGRHVRKPEIYSCLVHVASERRRFIMNRREESLKAIIAFLQEEKAKGTLEQGQTQVLESCISDLRRVRRTNNSAKIWKSIDRVARAFLRMKNR
jgi:hypothetical protein